MLKRFKVTYRNTYNEDRVIFVQAETAEEAVEVVTNRYGLWATKAEEAKYNETV